MTTALLFPVTVVVLNSCYVRYVTRVQIFLTAAKMAALALIIVSGAIHIAKGMKYLYETKI